jgi:antitoxin YefM
MDTISYTSARQNLAKTMERVCANHEAIIITRSNEQSVVMMSLKDFNALEETAYLLRNPKNAK